MTEFESTSRLPARLAAAVAAAVLAVPVASQAAALTVTTRGVVTSGSDAGNLLGAGTDLTGDAYTLVIVYDPASGPGFYSSGGFASDNDALTGAVTLTVAGHSMTTTLATSYGATLAEDAWDLVSGNAGVDAAGNYVSASQDVSALAAFIATIDLQSGVSYRLAAGDYGADSYTFDDAGFTQSITLDGTPASITLATAVPEPASWLAMAAALAGMGLAARRGKSPARA